MRVLCARPPASQRRRPAHTCRLVPARVHPREHCSSKQRVQFGCASVLHSCWGELTLHVQVRASLLAHGLDGLAAAPEHGAHHLCTHACREANRRMVALLACHGSEGTGSAAKSRTLR